MAIGNRAPECLWHEQLMLCGTRRRRLWVNGAETAYFIDTADAVKHRQARGKGDIHSLYGSGQSEPGLGRAGSAAFLAGAARLELLKHRAEQIATP